MNGNSKKIHDYLVALLPSRFVGDADRMRKDYKSVSLASDPASLVENTIRKTAAYYLILGVALIVSIVCCIQGLTAGSKLPELYRNDWGGKAQRIGAGLTADYKGERVKRSVTVIVRPKQASAMDIQMADASIKKRLPKLILGANESLCRVTSDLSLVSKDRETGAGLSWSSDREDLISENGAVNLLGAYPGEVIFLTATIRLGKAIDHMTIRTVIGSPGASHNYTPDLNRSVSNLVSEINKDSEGDRVFLPESAGNGVTLSWRKPVSKMLIFMPLIIAALVYFVYRGRYSPVKKEIHRLKSDMRREFPDFLAKLLLLLGAGLVVSSAVSRIADDYRKRRRNGEEKALYEELIAMEERMKASGTSLTAEFSELAMRSSQREIMRFSTILSDNIDKGSALTEKLAREEHTLRLLRKKNTEERARIAETKLTFPMALELFAVILITAAPAVMQMSA